MSWFRKFADGLWSLFRKEQVSKELDEELDSFVEMATEEKMGEGMTSADAVRAVRLERGSVEVAKEVVYAAGWESVVEGVWRDIRFGVRSLRKSSGFSAVVVLTLTLGIGANTAVFTLLNAVMLESLPVPNPTQLYRLGDNNNCCSMTGTQSDGSFVLYSHPLYEDLRDHTPEFEQLANRHPECWFAHQELAQSEGPAVRVRDRWTTHRQPHQSAGCRLYGREASSALSAA